MKRFLLILLIATCFNSVAMDNERKSQNCDYEYCIDQTGSYNTFEFSADFTDFDFSNNLDGFCLVEDIGFSADLSYVKEHFKKWIRCEKEFNFINFNFYQEQYLNQLHFLIDDKLLLG